MDGRCTNRAQNFNRGTPNLATFLRGGVTNFIWVKPTRGTLLGTMTAISKTIEDSSISSLFCAYTLKEKLHLFFLSHPTTSSVSVYQGTMFWNRAKALCQAPRLVAPMAPL